MDLVEIERISQKLQLIQGLVLRPGARDVARLGVAVPGQTDRLVATLVECVTSELKIAFVTGAYMAWAAPPAAETDGPVGVALLAAALAAAGGVPLVITDELCESVTRACLEAAQVPASSLFVVSSDASEEDVVLLVSSLAPAQLIAVERLGPNRDGRVLTMRGVDITKFTAPLHAAFENTSAITGAIGDGGNEIGMGNIAPSTISKSIEHGELIACRTTVRDLMVAGTSNWGCYGLISSLALLCPRLKSRIGGFLDPELERHVLNAAQSAGGIDGVSGLNSTSVDGVSWAEYRELILALRDIAE